MPESKPDARARNVAMNRATNHEFAASAASKEVVLFARRHAPSSLTRKRVPRRASIRRPPMLASRRGLSRRGWDARIEARRASEETGHESRGQRRIHHFGREQGRRAFTWCHAHSSLTRKRVPRRASMPRAFVSCIEARRASEETGDESRQPRIRRSGREQARRGFAPPRRVPRLRVGLRWLRRQCVGRAKRLYMSTDGSYDAIIIFLGEGR